METPPWPGLGGFSFLSEGAAWSGPRRDRAPFLLEPSFEQRVFGIAFVQEAPFGTGMPSLRLWQHSAKLALHSWCALRLLLMPAASCHICAANQMNS